MTTLSGIITPTNIVTATSTTTMTNKTLTAPIISSISNTGTLTLPTSTDTLVGRATTDTLTNKTLSLSGNTITGTLPVANGGTNLSATGASGNVLTSNGTAWVSQAPIAGAQIYTALNFGGF